MAENYTVYFMVYDTFGRAGILYHQSELVTEKWRSNHFYAHIWLLNYMVNIQN